MLLLVYWDTRERGRGAPDGRREELGYARRSLIVRPSHSSHNILG